MECDVLIVGSGLTAATLARLLKASTPLLLRRSAGAFVPFERSVKPRLQAEVAPSFLPVDASNEVRLH